MIAGGGSGVAAWRTAGCGIVRGEPIEQTRRGDQIMPARGVALGVQRGHRGVEPLIDHRVGHLRERATIILAQVIEVLAERALEFGVRDPSRALADRDLIAPMVEARDADTFFRRPPKVVPFAVRDARMPLFRPRDGACLDLSFDSPYVPVNPRIRKSYVRHVKNRTGHARWWRHERGPRPTIIAVHGFNADLYHLNEWFFAIPWMYRLGFDVMLYTLPFHGPRRTRLSPFSGHGFFAGGIARINEAFGQSIFES